MILLYYEIGEESCDTFSFYNQSSPYWRLYTVLSIRRVLATFFLKGHLGFVPYAQLIRRQERFLRGS